MNEVRILASLKHAHILPYMESFMEDDTLCMVLELADQGDVQKFIKQHADKNIYIPEVTVWKILIQMVSAQD